MMITRLPDNLPQILRDAGLKVVEVDGWRTNGRPGPFTPVGVLNHHTGASAVGWGLRRITAYLRFLFHIGRPDLPAPLCQLSLGRDGTVYIGAAGRANHAGVAKARGTVAAGDGNTLYVGIEWMLSGTERIPAVMYDAGLLLNAVLLDKVLGTSVQTVAAHYETSVTGKWDIGDPNGVAFNGQKVLDMVAFRIRVEKVKAGLSRPAPKPTAVTKARVLLERALKRAKAGSSRAARLAAALKRLPRR
jgi:hypothetical protein